MICALLLQVSSLLPPAPAAPTLEDRGYRARVQTAVLAGELRPEELEELRPADTVQAEELRRWLLQGDRRQARLAALLVRPTASPELRVALIRRAWQEQDEGTTLACLLAAAPFPAAYWVAAAWITQDPQRPLSVRAAAAAGLLEADCPGVWPWCRSLLRSGTAGDEDAPWADWRRGSRWELPKRILVLALDRWLVSHGEEVSGVEPNAAWAVQLQQLAAVEKRVQKIRDRLAPHPLPAPDDPVFTTQVALMRMAAADNQQARLALPWLMPHLRPMLLAALNANDLTLAQLAREVLAEIPR